MFLHKSILSNYSKIGNTISILYFLSPIHTMISFKARIYCSFIDMSFCVSSTSFFYRSIILLFLLESSEMNPIQRWSWRTTEWIKGRFEKEGRSVSTCTRSGGFRQAIHNWRITAFAMYTYWAGVCTNWARWSINVTISSFPFLSSTVLRMCLIISIIVVILSPFFLTIIVCSMNSVATKVPVRPKFTSISISLDWGIRYRLQQSNELSICIDCL